MINIENLQKSFGGQVLFDGLAFKVNARERVGLVGRNGHGKTTLFRIIAGEEAYDGGALTIPEELQNRNCPPTARLYGRHHPFGRA